MNRSFYRTILAALALTMFGAAAAQSQTQHQNHPDDRIAATQTSSQSQEQMHHEMPKMGMSGMMNEPHHVLAAAYRQNIGTFAKALRDQAQTGIALSADFARAAVAEMNRSFDQAEEHHREHIKTMSADMRARMAARMKEMEVHHSRLKAAIAALEKDVQDYTLNSKKIATDSADVVRHLDEMSKMHNGR